MSLAQTGKEKPLDLNVYGFKLEPQLMPYVEKWDGGRGEQRPLHLDGKRQHLLLPALRGSSGGVDWKLGIKPSRKRLKVVLQATF